MTKRGFLIALSAAAVAALLAVGAQELATRGSSSRLPTAALTKAQMQARLAGAPAPLAALHAQGGALLDGGARALRARLAALKGWPTVVDKWASWCTSCKAERDIFQRAAVEEGRRVAFIGVDSGDTSRADAESFLREAPPSYPSYYDASGKLGAEVTDSSFTPVTVFYDARGGRFIHQGPYESVAELERDVERYATGAAGA
jgi:cytochrome c biogenesis protein CcmG/thiol:disulfide interchange protein DsbE